MSLTAGREAHVQVVQVSCRSSALPIYLASWMLWPFYHTMSLTATTVLLSIHA